MKDEEDPEGRGVNIPHPSSFILHPSSFPALGRPRRDAPTDIWRGKSMNVRVFNSRLKLAEAAGSDAAGLIRQAIAARDHAYLIAATGASQFEFLEALVLQPEIAWAQVTF